MKEAPKFFEKILTLPFNESLKRGVFPNVLKLAIIVPIFKGGQKENFVYYRPIALLSTIAKIFERCIKEKLLNYLEHINFFASEQFGFMRAQSTDTALFQHVTQITEYVENIMHR